MLPTIDADRGLPATRTDGIKAGDDITQVVVHESGRNCSGCDIRCVANHTQSGGSVSCEGVEEKRGEAVWDLLVVGGGLIGLYTAVEAAQRGLRVALVEAQDLGNGNTSHFPGFTPGPLAYVQRALRQREPAWLMEAWRVLRRQRIWSAVTGTPFSTPSAAPLSSSLPSSPPVVWGSSLMGIATHHFTEWFELSVASVFTSLLTVCSGFGDVGNSWMSSGPRWISASRWNKTIMEGEKKSKREQKYANSSSNNSNTKPSPHSSGITDTASTTGTLGQNNVEMLQRETGSVSKGKKEGVFQEEAKEEEEIEPVYGVVCASDRFLHGPLLAVRLARTADALGVCILTYAPLCALEWMTPSPTVITARRDAVAEAHLIKNRVNTSSEKETYPSIMGSIGEENKGKSDNMLRRGSRESALHKGEFDSHPCGDSSSSSSTPFFRATIADLLYDPRSPCATSSSNSASTSPSSSPLHHHTVYARRVINCSGAWVDEVKSLLPENVEDPLPCLLDEKKPIQVKNYLVVPRAAVQSLENSTLLHKGERDSEEATTFPPPSSSPQSAFSSILRALKLDGLQVSPTRYTFSPTLVLPWVDDCVLVGPSYAVLPSLPSWSKIGLASPFLSSTSPPSVSVGHSTRMEKSKKGVEVKESEESSKWWEPLYKSVTQKASPGQLKRGREKEHPKTSPHYSSSVITPSCSSTSSPNSNMNDPAMNTVPMDFPSPSSHPRCLGYHIHMMDGHAGVVSRLLNALAASHIYVVPDAVQSCVSSWMPIIRSPSSFSPGKGDGPLSSYHVALLSNYLFRQYHIGVSRILRRKRKSVQEGTSEMSKENEEGEGIAGGEIKAKQNRTRTSSSSFSSPSRSPLMEVVAGSRPDYYYRGKGEQEEGDGDEREGEERRGATGLGGNKAKDRQDPGEKWGSLPGFMRRTVLSSDTTSPAESSSSSSSSQSCCYETIPFVHIYGGTPVQARDIALDAVEKILQVRPFLAGPDSPISCTTRTAGGGGVRDGSLFTSRGWGWGWWTRKGREKSKEEGGNTETSGEEERRGTKCSAKPLPSTTTPIHISEAFKNNKPLVLLPLPWDAPVKVNNKEHSQHYLSTSRILPETIRYDSPTAARAISSQLTSSLQDTNTETLSSSFQRFDENQHGNGSSTPYINTHSTNTSADATTRTKERAEESAEVDTRVRMMVRYAYAEKVSDILFRRWRVGYCNPAGAAMSARVIAEVMGDELHWSRERVEEEIQEALEDIEGTRARTM